MNTEHRRGAVQATAGMLLVGSLVAVSARIDTYPVYGGQALRYAVGATALLIVLRLRRTRDTSGAAAAPVRVTGRQWALLAALSVMGLVVFNTCIVLAGAYASPAAIGTIIGSSPVVMALAGPLLARTRPEVRVLAAAGIVTAGTVLATGFGGASLPGVLLAVGALAGEVSFSLLAVPLLPALGAVRVSAYAAVIAVPLLLVVGVAVDGVRGVLRVPTLGEAAGFAYLGVVVTAVAFLLWYDALPRLGAGRAGLFVGVMPMGTVITMLVLGLGLPGAAELGGVALVAVGIGVGLSGRRGAGTAAEEPGAGVRPVALSGAEAG